MHVLLATRAKLRCTYSVRSLYEFAPGCERNSFLREWRAALLSEDEGRGNGDRFNVLFTPLRIESETQN
jgi:hypothetical protein